MFTNFGNLVTSVIRTIVPLIVGALLSWLAINGITVDEVMKANLVIGLTTFLQIAYYLVARFIERRFPQVGGLLLGSAKQPTYTEKPHSDM